ncbi:MAG TPA: hypothetical protein VEA63_15465, partial [Opitutus sp.]|nr:hypothetical protein [Opitutus sp.]
MKSPRFLASLLFAGLSSLTPMFAAEPIKLATPSASAEAVGLFEYLLQISGKHTLSGQHCVPLVGSTRLPGVHKALGHYPAV